MYYITYNGIPLRADKQIHKKSGLYRYKKGTITISHTNVDLILFDTELQTCKWLLANSSMPHAIEYTSLIEDVNLAYKLILNFSYKFQGFAITTPYLCEFIIQEYNENSNNK